MYQPIQFKTTNPPVRYSASTPPLRRGFLVISLVLACLALSPPAQAQLPNIFAADNPGGSVNSGGANIAYLQNTTGSNVTLVLDGNTITTRANRLNIFDRSSGIWVLRAIQDQQSQPVSPGSQGSTLLSGLTAYYALSGLTDASGHGLTLTNHGTVTFVTGKVGNAANFVSVSNQYLTHADATQFQMGTGDFSFAFWVKFRNTGTKVVFTYGLTNINSGYAVQTDGDSLHGFIDDGTHIADCGAVHVWSDNNWHLCIVTCSRSGNMQMYVDNATEGAAVSITTVSGSVNDTEGFAIGANTAGGVRLDGSIDEFGLWNRVLTSTEITHLWNGGAGTTYPFTGL